MANGVFGGASKNWWDSGYAPLQQSQYGGGPDYAKSLMPTISGLDASGLDMGSTGNTGPGWLSMEGILGGTNKDGMKTPGWGGAAIGVAQGLGNAYMAMKQYGLAKDTFNENKRQFALNFGAQQKTTNSRLEDRQKARVASNAGAYQSVGDYMKANGI